MFVYIYICLYIYTYVCIYIYIYIYISYDALKLDELEIPTTKSGFVKKIIVFVTRWRVGKCFLKNETIKAVSVTIARNKRFKMKNSHHIPI